MALVRRNCCWVPAARRSLVERARGEIGCGGAKKTGSGGDADGSWIDSVKSGRLSAHVCAVMCERGMYGKLHPCAMRTQGGLRSENSAALASACLSTHVQCEQVDAPKAELQKALEDSKTQGVPLSLAAIESRLAPLQARGTCVCNRHCLGTVPQLGKSAHLRWPAVKLCSPSVDRSDLLHSAHRRGGINTSSNAMQANAERSHDQAAIEVEEEAFASCRRRRQSNLMACWSS